MMWLSAPFISSNPALIDVVPRSSAMAEIMAASSPQAGFDFQVRCGLVPAHLRRNGFGKVTERAFIQLRQNQKGHAAAQQIAQMNNHFRACTMQQVSQNQG